MTTAPPLSPTTRLPSPPPIAEDQTSPKSPNLAPADGTWGGAASSSDLSASRRIRPGTKAADMAEGPPLIDLSDIDTPFQLTEHLKSLHHHYTHPSESSLTEPITRTTAKQLSTAPAGIERTLWLYELCRFLTARANTVIVALFADDPPCSASTCPEMRASEWQYLCAVHDPPKPCCAIDYCCHTLDNAANLLTSPRQFPSRLAMGGSNAGDQGYATAAHQVRHITNIFRRVYRIYAHAWFSHREMFWRVESRTGLYTFFKTVCDDYNLIPDDNYTIPAEAEGEKPSSPTSSAPTGILKRSDDASTPLQGSNPQTTRRHRHAPSSGAPGTAAVASVPEEDEDDSRGSVLLMPGPELERPNSIVEAPGLLPSHMQAPTPRSIADPPTPVAMPPPSDMGIKLRGRDFTELQSNAAENVVEEKGVDEEVAQPAGGAVPSSGEATEEERSGETRDEGDDNDLPDLVPGDESEGVQVVDAE